MQRKKPLTYDAKFPCRPLSACMFVIRTLSFIHWTAAPALYTINCVIVGRASETVYASHHRVSSWRIWGPDVMWSGTSELIVVICCRATKISDHNRYVVSTTFDWPMLSSERFSPWFTQWLREPPSTDYDANFSLPTRCMTHPLCLSLARPAPLGCGYYNSVTRFIMLFDTE